MTMEKITSIDGLVARYYAQLNIDLTNDSLSKAPISKSDRKNSFITNIHLQ